MIKLASPLTSIALALSIPLGVQAVEKPNILFILADDLGWGALSCYGDKDISTPNLDRLAGQGMRFNAAYADAQCSPTRAALFSGQYGARSGVFKVIHEKEPPKAFLRPPDAVLAMPPDVANLASSLRDAGYTTGLSGKWHIADDYPAAPLRDRGEGRYFDRYGFDFCGGANEKDHAEDKAVAAITDDILGFIEKAGERPWFACAMHFTTHTALRAPRALVEKHAARGYRRTTAPFGKYSERPTAEYLAMLEHLDNEIGRMMSRLDGLGLAQDTLVIFTSDNGGMSRVAGNAPLREGKGSPYEGGIRVPLIVRWPGKVKAGSECDTPVHTVDYYPTLAALAAAKPPAGHKLDGVSLLPLLTQSGTLARDTLAWHMPTYTAMYGRTPCAVIRKGEWKLIHWFGDYLDPRGFTPDDTPYGKLVIGPRTELYNLREDASETTDLASKHPDKARELRAALEAWWKDTGARFPERNPDFDEAAWWGTRPAASKAKARADATNDAVGLKATARLTPADISQVDVGGEWGDRSELMRREILTWHPTFQGIKKTGKSGPLDFDRDILALWTPEGRIPAAGLREHPQSYTGLGKALVAMADFAADKNDPAFTAKKDRIVEAILKSQEADGYLGIVKRDPAHPAAALWQAWNLHDGLYLCLGLIENYRLFHHRPSLDATRRYADCVIANWPDAPKKPGALSPIGLPEMLLALSESTGDPKYREFAANTPMDGRFIECAAIKDWRQELFPMRNERDASAGGAADAAATKFKSKVHSYRYFARLLEQLRLYKADRDPGLFAMSRYTAGKISNPDTPGVFITGANSRSEGWVEDQVGKGTVGEGCAVVHMVWWRSRLIETDGDLSHGDFIERAILNHLEASQEPVTGQTRYDCMLSGERNFHKGAHCCDGNHKRFWARIEELVFYTFPGGIAVDQFTPAGATLEVDGQPVKITAEAAYPASGNITLRLTPKKPATFALRLRIPRWAKSHTVTVNDSPAESKPVPGGIEIKREWRAGDSVGLEFPMPFRWVAGMKFYEGHAALMRGPQVFCLAPSRNPELAGIKDWREITVDPASVELLPHPEPDGVRVPIEAKARAWSPGKPPVGPPDIDLVFSDFPIGDGFETYFRLGNPETAQRDELYRGPVGALPPPAK